jgi:HEPN domain-containing protein
MAKAILIALGTEPPKIHDIEVLAELVDGCHAELGNRIRDLAVLTTWYFAARYPEGLEDSLPSSDQVKTTLDKLGMLRRHIDSLAPKA